MLPLFFIRLWVPIWFGLGGGRLVVVDVLSREFLIMSLSTLAGIILGIWPTLLFGLF